MADDATDSPPGTVIDMESYRTEYTASAQGLTRKRIRAGSAMSTIEKSTPAHNSPLSADEARTLARIRKDRRNGFMVSAPDVDFLIGVIARLGA